MRGVGRGRREIGKKGGSTAETAKTDVGKANCLLIYVEGSILRMSHTPIMAILAIRALLLHTCIICAPWSHPPTCLFADTYAV